MTDSLAGSYTGPVCYVDGWHCTVGKNENNEDVPGERLVLEEDGSYRLATEEDESHHDRHHQSFVNIEMEDGSEAVQVNPEEYAAIQEMLRQRRGE